MVFADNSRAVAGRCLANQVEYMLCDLSRSPIKLASSRSWSSLPSFVAFIIDSDPPLRSGAIDGGRSSGHIIVVRE